MRITLKSDPFHTYETMRPLWIVSRDNEETEFYAFNNAITFICESNLSWLEANKQFA